MALIDRYGLRALIAVGVQVAAWFAVLVYGLWSPSLGARLTLPTLAMLPVWIVLAWLTLTRPWDWGGLEPRQPLQRIWGYWEAGVVYGGIYGVVRMHLLMLSDAKAILLELRRLPTEIVDPFAHARSAEAWAADTYGALILSGAPLGWGCVAGALFVVGLAWFLLPR